MIRFIGVSRSSWDYNLSNSRSSALTFNEHEADSMLLIELYRSKQSQFPVSYIPGTTPACLDSAGRRPIFGHDEGNSFVWVEIKGFFLCPLPVFERVYCRQPSDYRLGLNDEHKRRSHRCCWFQCQNGSFQPPPAKIRSSSSQKSPGYCICG